MTKKHNQRSGAERRSSSGFSELGEIARYVWKRAKQKWHGSSLYQLDFDRRVHFISTVEEYDFCWQQQFNDAISKLSGRAEHQYDIKPEEIVEVIWEHGLLGYYSPAHEGMKRAAKQFFNEGYYLRKDARLYTRLLYACRYYVRSVEQVVQRGRSFARIMTHFMLAFGNEDRLRRIFSLPSFFLPEVGIGNALLDRIRTELKLLQADPHEFTTINGKLVRSTLPESIIGRGVKWRMLEVDDVYSIFVTANLHRIAVPVVVRGFLPDGRIVVRGETTEAQVNLVCGEKHIGVLPTDFSMHKPGYSEPIEDVEEDGDHAIAAEELKQLKQRLSGESASVAGDAAPTK